MLFPDRYSDNPRNLMLRCGYAERLDPNTAKVSYVRRLGEGFYPRFHAYLEDHKDGFVVALHLDQKKTSLDGNQHGGEYGGEAVKNEIMRIASIIVPLRVG